MINAYIFDLDGVLVDTAVFHYKAWKKMANGLGFDIDEKFNEKLKGISRVASLDLILEKGGLVLSEEEKVSLATQKNADYLSMVEQMTPDDILPGVTSFLENAKANGKKIALGSASKNARLILEKVGIIHFFDALVDGNSVSKSKPDPEVFTLGGQLLHVLPTECLVFEDAYAGIEAAHNAGMKALGIGMSHDLPNSNAWVPNLLGYDVSQIDSMISN
ncbi:MAG: beta-phosphoglucomutase [Leadbetterella sp.]